MGCQNDTFKLPIPASTEFLKNQQSIMKANKQKLQNNSEAYIRYNRYSSLERTHIICSVT